MYYIYRRSKYTTWKITIDKKWSIPTCKKNYLVSERKLFFFPSSASKENFHPRNSGNMPAGKMFLLLEREKNSWFPFRHYLWRLYAIRVGIYERIRTYEKLKFVASTTITKIQQGQFTTTLTLGSDHPKPQVRYYIVVGPKSEDDFWEKGELYNTLGCFMNPWHPPQESYWRLTGIGTDWHYIIPDPIITSIIKQA